MITDLHKTTVIQEPDNSHNGNIAKCEAAKARAKMLETAAAPPYQVVVDTLHEFSPDVQAAPGSMEAHRQAVRRVHQD